MSDLAQPREEVGEHALILTVHSRPATGALAGVERQQRGAEATVILLDFALAHRQIRRGGGVSANAGR